MSATLNVTPLSALSPEGRSIRAGGFEPGERVEISARIVDEAGVPWTSRGAFVADRAGEVDVGTAPSESGSYTGIDEAGLFWSLQPNDSDDPSFMVNASAKAHQLGQPLFDPLAPITVELSASGDSGSAAALTTLVRLAPGIVATPFREGRLRGMAFRWADRSRRRGAIVSLTGSGGGIEMGYAPLLASLGYDVLSLAYFNHEDLPPGIENIPLEYFEEAFTWIRTAWDPIGIAVQGASRGGELSLLLAATFPEHVSGTVAIVPMYASAAGWNSTPLKPTASWTFRGKEVPYASSPDEMSLDDMFELARTTTAPLAFTLESRRSVDNPKSRASAPIPVERAGGPILMISGVEDAMWPSSWGSDVVMDRLRAMGFSHAYSHLALRETGHITPLPNQVTTFCPSLYHTLVKVFLACGGNPQGTARNSQLTWDAMRAHYAALFG